MVGGRRIKWKVNPHSWQGGEKKVLPTLEFFIFLGRITNCDIFYVYIALSNDILGYFMYHVLVFLAQKNTAS